jgi:hemolysin III
MIMFSKLREPVNGLTHLGGAIIAFFGLIAMLLISWGATTKIVSVLVYGLGLISMFFASAIYHMAKVKTATLQVLRKIDHSAIFLLIAGTYTPYCLIAFTGFWRWGLLSIIWTIAVIGIAVKIVSINSPRWLHVAIYVVMGWLCIMAAPQMAHVMPIRAITWLIVGGVIYTFGALVYAPRIFAFVPGKFGFHEVWHIFVLVGALAHFISVMALLTAPAVL